jgi:hypothetical protein
MAETIASDPAEFHTCAGSKVELYCWFLSEGASVGEAAKAIRLLQKTLLLSTPYPRRWNRRGDFGVQEHCRYLWYRHGAVVLGWSEQKKYPTWVQDLLNHDFYSDVTTEAQGACSCPIVDEEPYCSACGSRANGRGERHVESGK